jgi:predicted RNase H-like HicB family nuclease
LRKLRTTKALGDLVRGWETVASRASAQYRFGAMNDPLRLTIDYKTGDDGWIIASVPEVPGAHSQGRTRKEARANVIDALRGVLELRLGEHAINEPGGDRERLELTIA